MWDSNREICFTLFNIYISIEANRKILLQASAYSLSTTLYLHKVNIFCKAVSNQQLLNQSDCKCQDINKHRTLFLHNIEAHGKVMHLTGTVLFQNIQQATNYETFLPLSSNNAALGCGFCHTMQIMMDK